MLPNLTAKQNRDIATELGSFVNELMDASFTSDGSIEVTWRKNGQLQRSHVPISILTKDCGKAPESSGLYYVVTNNNVRRLCTVKICGQYLLIYDDTEKVLLFNFDIDCNGNLESGWDIDSKKITKEEAQKFYFESYQMPSNDFVNAYLRKSSMNAKHSSFEQWMELVDEEVWRLMGVSVYDLPDYPYRDKFNDDCDPELAALHSIESAEGID